MRSSAGVHILTDVPAFCMRTSARGQKRHRLADDKRRNNVVERPEYFCLPNLTVGLRIMCENKDMLVVEAGKAYMKKRTLSWKTLSSSTRSSSTHA